MRYFVALMVFSCGVMLASAQDFTIGLRLGADYAQVRNAQFSSLEYGGAEFNAAIDWINWKDWYVSPSSLQFAGSNLTNPAMNNVLSTMQFHLTTGYLFGGTIDSIKTGIWGGPFLDIMCYDSQNFAVPNNAFSVRNYWYMDAGIGPGIFTRTDFGNGFSLRFLAEMPLAFLSFHPEWSGYPYNIESMKSLLDIAGTGKLQLIPEIARWQAQIEGLYEFAPSWSLTLSWRCQYESRNFAEVEKSLRNTITIGLEYGSGGQK